MPDFHVNHALLQDLQHHHNPTVTAFKEVAVTCSTQLGAKPCFRLGPDPGPRKLYLYNSNLGDKELIEASVG